ncbi:MAG: hypothetical protein ACQEQM_01735 [Thermoplasmatota archaeon]
MKMISECHVCGKPATRSCSLCGLATCQEHLYRGACAECRRAGMSEETEEKKRHYSRDDVYS